MKSWIWNAWIRVPLFWLFVFIISSALYILIAPLYFYEFRGIIAEAILVSFDRIADPKFVQSLAVAIGSLASGIAGAYGVMHAFLIPCSINKARDSVKEYGSKQEFDRNFDALSAKLSRHVLLGHAWDKFAECIIRKDGEPLKNTQRPQSYFTYAMLREKLTGLKIMPGIPSYFVGAGLLLTFVGLVLALQQAAEGTQAAQHAAGGKGAEAMKTALENLLHAASFKFYTSIAGLGASIFLSFFFRLYSIHIESALSNFCEELDKKMTYLASQTVAVEMRESLAAQLSEIKEINGDKFFARLGEKVAPAIDTAMTKAVAPLAEEIGAAVSQLRENSQTGVQDMLQRFSETIHGGAGTELREIGKSLYEVRNSIEAVGANMDRSGQDFAAQLSQAADNLKNMIAEIGRGLREQSAGNVREQQEMHKAFSDLFERASKRVDENLSAAADGASLKLTDVMERVLQKLEEQVTGLEKSFGVFRDTAAGHLRTLHGEQEEAQRKSVQAVLEAYTNAARALEDGLAKSTETVRTDMARSGQDFAAQLGKAAANLRDMIGGIGHGLSEQSAANVRAQQEMHKVFTDLFERASQKMDENLASAADGASSKLTAAMDLVLQKLEGQVTGLEKSFGAFRDTAAGHLDTLRRQLEDAQGNGIKAVSAASAGAAKALEEGLGGVIEKIGSQIEEFVQALQASTTALDDQIEAMDDLTGRTKENASTFERAAEAVRSAVEPVTRSNERIEAITAKFEGSLAHAATSLKEGQQATTALATSLDKQVSTLKQAWQDYSAALTNGWNDYRARFEKVDADLQKAFEKLSSGTQEQTSQFAGRISAIDQHLADAITKLASPINEMSEGAQSIADSVDKLKKALLSKRPVDA